ncbi:hypothetical protein [uncultured Thiodictyon sp.]|uniref:hypothetical protein n=1 Tax=uncultured Thiodictyon sp. TaxID=1846217 RepID=UPI0025E5EED2|nr:hypothetical protein [uncultured Thiodictyon sp.]
MQLTLELPDQLAEQLAALPDPQGFVIDLLAKSLTGGLSQDEWWVLLQESKGVVVDTVARDRHNSVSGNSHRQHSGEQVSEE